MEPEIKVFQDSIYNHPIFSGASAAEFGGLMEECTLRTYEKDENILYSASPRNGLLLMLEGLTEVYVALSDREESHEVLEVLEPPDIIGFSSLADFLGEQAPFDYPHTVEVQAVEESVCLHIPYSVMEARWRHEEVRDYVLRQVSIRLRDIYASLAEQVHLANQWGESDPFIQRVQDVMNTPVITISTDATIQEAAKTMGREQASSLVVVTEKNDLAGIITERDLVQRVIASGTSGSAAARSVMTENPHTISAQAYYYEAMSSFLVNGIKHLPVTLQEDAQQVIGMITLSDLLQKRNRGKFNVLQKMEEADAETLPAIKHAIYDILAHLIEDGIPALQLMNMITSLFDRLAQQCVKLAVEEVEKQHGKPPVPFAFFLMGSGGRAEQFMLTDQDHFLVYQDAATESANKEAAAYYRALGLAIVVWLERAGYKRCDGNMMASEASWRGTTSQWSDRLRTWGLRATNQNILLGHNFLAFRFLAGDQATRDQFARTVQEQLQASTIFLYRAAELEQNLLVPHLDHPVRALFRLKREGINIKKEALFPFHHSLQILAAKHHIFGGTPRDKIEALHRKAVFQDTFVDDLLFAYETVLKIRIEKSWYRYERGERPTSELKFSQMKSREKEALMHALKIIRSLQAQAVNAFGMRL
ncbi:DUF294 nucleotidyltransferase-like domain-containing protein [Bacillus piscicola]|uniref:DUF294 nucleotidyltransferase-like domain-containing protein n=1 Tax=Bacillus piscicola TaxID=1632684 RepID=UPI001F08A5C4|nr:DUF294 nucleotidyltransferase-like domain-containing protein [Bacillus piscicola]